MDLFLRLLDIPQGYNHDALGRLQELFLRRSPHQQVTSVILHGIKRPSCARISRITWLYDIEMRSAELTNER